ncbi:MAG: cpaB, partial [Solirubrobacterales bacterium]|nr:cpaB [Solirubrobacterales bacterium]
AVLLGGLAASDVAGREAELRRSLGAPVTVLVTREAVRPGAPLDRARLALRRVPARYAPADAFTSAGDVAGLKAAVAIPAGTDLTPSLAADPAQLAGAAVPVGPGERVAELVATGSAESVVPGSRVDVLVTRDTADQQGETTLALEDAEVLRAAPAPAARGADPAPRVAVALRVRLRDAVYLAAAQSFARELRVLPRAEGDRRRGAAGLRVGSGL